MPSEQDRSSPQPRHHFITWGAFFKKDCGSDHSSRNVRSGSKTSVWFLLTYLNNQSENHCSPKLTTVCNPNLSPSLGLWVGFLTLLWFHFSTWLSLPNHVNLSFCMNLCAALHITTTFTFLFCLLCTPKDTLASVGKMLFCLSVSSLSNVQDQAYSRCLVNHCGLKKVSEPQNDLCLESQSYS